MSLYLSDDRIEVKTPSGVKILDSDDSLSQLITVEEVIYSTSGVEVEKSNSLLFAPAVAYNYFPGPVNTIRGISHGEWILNTTVDSLHDVFIFYKIIGAGEGMYALPSGWQMLQGSAILEMYGPQSGPNYYRDVMFPKNYWGMLCMNLKLSETGAIIVSVTGTVACITNEGGLIGFQNSDGIALHAVRSDYNADPIYLHSLTAWGTPVLTPTTGIPRKVMLGDSAFTFAIKVCKMDKI